MQIPRTLSLCRTRAHQQARLRDAADQRVWTIADLYERLRAWAAFSPLPHARRTISRDDLGARLLAAAVLAGDTDDGGAWLPRLAPGLDALRKELVHARTSATELLTAIGGEDPEDEQGRRAEVRRLLARVAEVEDRLAAAGVVDDATALARAQRLLLQGERPGFLRGVERVVIDLAVDATALEVDLLCALRRHVHVVVRLPVDTAPGRFALEGLDAVFRAFERTGDAGALEIEPVDVVAGVDPGDPQTLSPLRAALFSDAVVSDVPVAVRLLDDEAAEARFVAGAVAALRAGDPRCRVAVAARDEDRLPALADALVRHGLPVRRRRRPLVDSPAARLFLDLYALRQDGAPRDRLLSVLVSPARRDALPTDDGARVLSTLRRAAARRDVEDVTRPFGGYRHRLERLVLRDPHERAAVDDALAAIEPVLALAGRLPLRASLDDHFAVAVDVVRAAVDEARGLGGAELLELVARLAQGIVRVGAPRAPVELATVVRLLHRELEAQPWLDDVVDVDDDAVEVLGLPDLAGRSFDHVVVARCVEGELPLPPPRTGLLGDVDRRALNRALGRRALRLLDDAETSEGGAAARGVGIEGAWWLLAMAAASSSVLLTAPRHDARGREHAPSAFLLDVARALGTDPEGLLQRGRAGRDVVIAADPRAHRVALARASLDAEGQAAPAVHAAVDDARLFARMAGERARFFAKKPGASLTDDLPARRGAFAFAVDGKRVARAFGDSFGLSPERPLTPTRLEALAECRVHGFVQHVLKVDVDAEPGNAIEARVAGTLAHGVLERFYAERRARRVPPSRMGADDRARLAAIVDEEAAPLLQGRTTGHLPALAASIAFLKRTLLRVTTTLARRPPIDGVEPVGFEVRIGTKQGGRDPEYPSVPIDVAPGRRLYLGGIIDRVDEGHGGRVVVDYKTMSGSRVREKAGSASLFQTHFQLLVYLRLLEHHRPTSAAVPLHGYLVSLKDGGVSADVGAVHDLRARVLDDQREDGLGRAIGRVVLPILEGTIPPDAGDRCSECRLQRVCRVPLEGVWAVDPDERPEDDIASTAGGGA